MKEYKFHTVANIFPMMNADEFSALKDDIKHNGLREPVWLYQNQIIDGRNRYLACKALAINPKYREYDGDADELINFVLSLNMHRRHLNTSQKACLAVNLMPEIESQNEKNRKKKISASKSGETVAKLPPSKKSRVVVAEMFGVSERYVQDAKGIKNKSEKLFDKILSGELTIQNAKKALKKSDDKNTVAKLPPSDEKIDVKLTKNDINKAESMVNHLNISKDKALNYIKVEKIKNKKKRIARQKVKAEKRTSIHVSLPESEKNRLKKLAEKKNIPLTELIRTAISLIEKDK